MLVNLGVRPFAPVLREWEGNGREEQSGLSVEGGRGGEEISGWHTVVRQKCRVMAARWFVEK